MSLTIRSQSRLADNLQRLLGAGRPGTSPSRPSSSDEQRRADLVVLDEQDLRTPYLSHSFAALRLALVANHAMHRMSVQKTWTRFCSARVPDDERRMRAGLLTLCVLLAVASTTAHVSRAKAGDVKPRLIQSYDAPAGDRLGDRIRGRAWTYDSAVTAVARALAGDLDGAGALLDTFQEIQRPDGALEGSYDLSGAEGAGPLRAGNQAWAGLAALQWRALTCSGRHDRLLVGLAGWLLAHRIDDPHSPGYGLVRGGPDVSWVSTEHNFEARAFFARLDATLSGRPVDGRRCQPGLDGLSGAQARTLTIQARDAVKRIDRAIDAGLYVRDGAGRAHFGQGLGDDVRALDVQALGILWLIGRGRAAEARAVERFTDETLRVDGRRINWPGAVRADVHRLSPVRRPGRPRRAVAGGNADDAHGQGAPRQPSRRARPQRRSLGRPDRTRPAFAGRPRRRRGLPRVARRGTRSVAGDQPQLLRASALGVR